MSEKSGARRAPYAGRLATRSLAAILLEANERGFTGAITLSERSRQATILVRSGRVASVSGSDLGPYLGTLLYESGAIDATVLDRSLLEVARTKKLHGQVLLEAKAITRPTLEAALAEQTQRKLIALFSLGDDTAYVERPEDPAEVEAPRDADRPHVDPGKAVWYGIRTRPIDDVVRAALTRLDGNVSAPNATAIGKRLGFDEDELTVAARLEHAPAALAQIVSTSTLGETRTQMLVYCLSLAKALRVLPLANSPKELGRAGIRALATRFQKEDPYTILGLPRHSSVEGVRAAFFRLARVWHPDRIPIELADVRSDCDAIFECMVEAHRTLTEPVPHLRSVPPPGSIPPPASLSEIDTALARNQIERAETLARSLAAGGRDGPRARAVLAWCSVPPGVAAGPDFDAAVGALDKILAGDPDCERALFYRGQLHKRAGRVDAAMRDFQKVLRIDPKHAGAEREVRLGAMRLPSGSGPKSEHGSGLRRLFARLTAKED